MLRSPVKPDRIVTPLVKLIEVPLRVPAVDDGLGFLQTNLAPNDLLHKRTELRVGGLFQERRVVFDEIAHLGVVISPGGIDSLGFKVWIGSHSVERLLTLRCDAMLDIIEELIGRDISLFHSKLLMKAAKDGTAIPWHQDYAYWKKESNDQGSRHRIPEKPLVAASEQNPVVDKGECVEGRRYDNDPPVLIDDRRQRGVVGEDHLDWARACVE